MFIFCCIITVSLAGLIWFRSFEEDLFVLINPDPKKQEQFYAERAQNYSVLAASIGGSYNQLKALVSDFLLFADTSEEDEEVEMQKSSSQGTLLIQEEESLKSDEKVYMLPVPESR